MAGFSTLALLGLAGFFAGKKLAKKAAAPAPTDAALQTQTTPAVTPPAPPEVPKLASDAADQARITAGKTRKRAQAGGAGRVTVPGSQRVGSTNMPKTLLGY